MYKSHSKTVHVTCVCSDLYQTSMNWQGKQFKWSQRHAPPTFVRRAVVSSWECKGNCFDNHLSTNHCNFSSSLSMQDGNYYLCNLSWLQITTGRAIMHCSVFWDLAHSSIPKSRHFPLICRRENHRLLYRMDQESDKRLVLWYEHPVLITTYTRREAINWNLALTKLFVDPYYVLPPVKPSSRTRSL